MTETAQRANDSSPNYQRAKGIKGRAERSTANGKRESRSVVTKKTTGSVTLRYAPREPWPGDEEPTTL